MILLYPEFMGLITFFICYKKKITFVTCNAHKVSREIKMSDQYRKWQLTFNDPIPKGWTHEAIKNKINEFSNVIYWCMSDETGLESQLFHTHLYMVLKNGVRISTIQNRFPSVHWDICKGSSPENRDYVFKEGKWLTDPKADTNHRDSHEEYGELPNERPGKRTDLDELYDMIKNGFSNFDILEENPQYIMQIDKLDRIRKTYQEEQYKNTWRDLEVTYIWGTTGSGKTRGVKEQYGYSNVYTVTDYTHPFDGYGGQDVILFEEFRSNLRIADMLQYLDGYPIELPCRYSNKVACFTKVYFCTNIDIRDQYRDIRMDYPETWNAFIRRIHKVKVYTGRNEYVVMDTWSYLKNMHFFFNGTPFDVESEKQADGQQTMEESKQLQLPIQ